MSAMSDQQIYDRLGEVKKLPTCSQWAAGFAVSIRQQIDAGRALSDRQKIVCHKIFKENNEEAQRSLANWEEEFRTQHKSDAIRLATYYKAQTAGYYGDVVKDILDGEVPTRAKYLKMCNNKYAKKVLAEIKRAPRFGIDDHVIPNSKFRVGFSFTSSMMSPRGGERWVDDAERSNLKKRGGIIIGVDDKILSSAKGAKRYLVLPFGSASTYWVEERYLKNKPKAKKVKK